MEFITAHAARLYRVALAVVALVAYYNPDLPSALIVGVVAAVLGTGEVVQRLGDDKTPTAPAGQDR
ncbi:hypothetical protein [Streptomyces luteireticuli]|uniref:Uncharacterized protein n=1 Tax=Streptomyces luteireticuli TaxID=173858 RepID=A0ABN0Z348_9ACTN